MLAALYPRLQASRNASEARSVYNESKKAKAAVPEIDSAPTAGKSIPIIVGAVKMTGDVIWIHTFKNSKNECRCHVAICFGRNPFGRSMGLVSLRQDGNYIYRRSKGATVDPPKAVRFYDGTQTEADPKILSIEGESKTPAFKGYSYAVLENVKLGDISAEVSDTTVEEPSVSVSLACDEDLEDIELVYNSYTGLYYGIESPGTDHAKIITSDGCRILRRAKIRFSTNQAAGGVTTFPIVYTVTPIRCSPLVTVTGYIGRSFIPDASPSEFPPAEWIVHPDSGLIDGGALWLTAASGSMYTDYDPYPDSTGIEIKASFALPGSGPGKFAVLKFLDRDDIVYETIQGVEVPLGAESNVSGAVFSMSSDLREPFFEGLGRVYGNNGQNYSSISGVSDCFDVALVSRAVPNNFINPDDTFTAFGWWLDEAPVLDDYIYLADKGGHADLGGYYVDGDDLLAYRLKYNEAGLVTEASATITPLGGWTGWSVSGINYDPDSDLFLISADPPPDSFLSPRIYRISHNGFSDYISTGLTGYKLMPASVGVSAGGYVPLQNADGSSIKKFNIQTGDTKAIYDGDAPTRQPVVDLNRSKFQIPTVGGVVSGATDQTEVGEISLVSLLTDCCAIKGYDDADLAFQNLSGYTLRGLQINSTIRISDLFNRLGSLYGFVFVETDRKLKFLKKRAGGIIEVDATLTADDLARADGQDSPIRTIQRASSNNLLGGMDLEFMNPVKDFENDTIKLRRPAGSFDVGASSRIETMSVPITIDPDDAYALLYEAFYGTIQKETRVGFSVMPWHARIEPGDCISLEVSGVETTGVAVRVTTRDDFAQDIELESYMADGETSLSPAEEDEETDSTTKVYGEYIHLDIPYLSPLDAAGPSKVMQYAGLTGATVIGWSGADLYRSNDGATFTKMLDYDFGPMTVGQAVNVLTQPALQFATDEASVLTITVERGNPDDFASQTYLEQMNGNIIAAYGHAGAWEIISWRDVTDNGDGTLSLTNLQRGMFGTHRAFDPTDAYGEGLEHNVGDYVCILDPVRVVKMQRGFSEVGATEWYGVATNTVGLDSAPKALNTLSGRGNRIPPIANLRALHHAGDTFMTISFEQQSQIAGGWNDNGAVNPPLEPISYVVAIYGYSDNYFIETAATSIVWEDYATDSSADASAEENNIYVEVFQISPSYPYSGASEDVGDTLTAAMGVNAREV